MNGRMRVKKPDPEYKVEWYVVLGMVVLGISALFAALNVKADYIYELTKTYTIYKPIRQVLQDWVQMMIQFRQPLIQALPLLFMVMTIPRQEWLPMAVCTLS